MESLEDGKISESHLVLLLQLIYAGGEVNALLKRGLQYTQIAELINEVVQEQLVEKVDTGLKITALGLEKIKTGAKDGIIRRNGGWISPLDEFRINKISTEEIFLPNSISLIEIAESLASSGKPRNGESSF